MSEFGKIFKSVDEQKEKVEAKIISGEIPDWLIGDFLQIGPGMLDFDSCSVNHLFDGLSSINKFSFGKNKLTFSSRHLQSDAYKHAMSMGGPAYTEFATKGRKVFNKNFIARMMWSFDAAACITDNASLNIFKIGGEYFCCSETSLIRRFDVRTLETKEKVDLAKYVCSMHAGTAHPYEELDGSIYNVVTSFFPFPKYNVVKVTPGKRKGSDVWKNAEVRVLASIPSRWKSSYSYCHSFPMTENYVIHIEMPFVVHLFSLCTANMKGRALLDCMEFFPNEPARFSVVDIRTGELKTTKYYSHKAFLFFHFTNAYEMDDHIIIDLISFPNLEVIDSLFLEQCRNEEMWKGNQETTRFVIPIAADIRSVSVGEELVTLPNCSASAMRQHDSHKGHYIELKGAPIGQHGFDLNCVNPKYKRKPYTYVYATGGFSCNDYTTNGIIKVNMETGETIKANFSDTFHCSEPVFVERPLPCSEDDGILLVTGSDTQPGEPNYVIILDAKTLNVEATLTLDADFCATFHGRFIPYLEDRNGTNW